MSGAPRWRDPAVLGAASFALFSGFGQFGVTAALGDAAGAFGEPMPTNGVAAEIGLAGTTIGIGLGIIRLASLGALPAAGLADRIGRRTLLIAACTLGLALTVLAGLMPSWWWFVVAFAAGRPLLSAVNAVAGVSVAEHTATADRSKAIALVGAAYAVGTGLIAGARGIGADVLGFHGVFLLAAVPLLLLPLATRFLQEPPRAATQRERAGQDGLRLGRVPRMLLPRLAVICAVHFGVGLVTGPVNTYLFAYGEQVVGLSPAVMTVLFISGGAMGLAGLLVGRWAADHLGRRPTAGFAMALTAGAGLLAYTGGFASLAAGYALSVFAASVYTPAAGSLDAEVFPTVVRSTVAGWVTVMQVLGAVVGLVVVGLLLDVTGTFVLPVAAVTLPVVGLAVLYTRLPETKDRDLDDIDAEATA